jgi:hypothetical protein
VALLRYQRARLQYQFNKLGPIGEGIYPEYGGNIEFELFSFFEICYHLKDWVKNSPEGSPFTDVEMFINSSPAMRICADICNRLKHKTLRTRRSKSDVGLFRISNTISVSVLKDQSRTMARIDKATIETERGEECCFALVKECMCEWERYFKENGA